MKDSVWPCGYSAKIRGLLLILIWISSQEAAAQLIEGGSNVCSVVAERDDKYHTDCGFLDWDRCTRYRVVYYFEFLCCNLWTQTNEFATGCTIPYCVSGWNQCPNGGTCTSALYCTCPRGYFSPDCQQCTGITNCDAHECTSATDQRCVTCDYEHTAIVRAYRPITSGSYPERICQQLCSWREDSKQCYPGSCSDDTPNSCSCAPDFGGTDCMEITTTPDITYCLGTLYDSAGETAEVSCENTIGLSKYTNIRVATLKVDWRTQYAGPSGTGPSGATYPYPYYVEDYDVGVVEARVDWAISRGSPLMYSVGGGSITCNDGISSDVPEKGLRVCDDVGTIPTALLSGDMMHISPKTTNGGLLVIKNHDNSASTFTRRNKYYTGMTLTHTARFIFDFDPPYHCLDTCGHNMLDIGAAYLKQPTFSMTWQGWTDARSGVRSYQYEVYKMKPLGAGDTAVLDYKTEPATATEIYDKLPIPFPTVTLTEPGMYCVLMIVYDDTSDDVLTANHRLARRFLLYDDSSQVETSDHVDHKMYVSSAEADSSYAWINNLDQPVTVKWGGHFFNEFHRTNLLLNAVASHSTDIDADYEERTGQPPSIRSMEAIPNVNGIIRYDLTFSSDQQGGGTLNAPPNTWETVTNFLDEEETKTVSRADGDTIKFWVQAYDVMDSTFTDGVVVHIDSSEPFVENVGLVRDGERLLVVHSNVDIFDMVVEFETYDYHSGMRQITWELQDMKDETVHGTGSVAVVSTNAEDPACVAPACYCIEKDDECYMTTYQIIPDQAKLNIPYGDHDFDYVFLITVVNNAMLPTTHRFQITIDVSPPQTGHVFDALPDNKDIDFQSILTVSAFWNGFFDRESGIKYYKYAIYESCLTDSDFEAGGSPPTQISTTYNTFASESMALHGTYYTTVVAYNHALEPSHPVCSDGITVDTTPPVVGSIHVKNAFIKPGLVSDGNNMMYMDGEGYVYELVDQTEDCSATSVNDLSLFESLTFSTPLEPNQDNCSSYTPAGLTYYMAAESKFEMTWAGSDPESTIHDYMIALSSTDTGNEDIMPYTSTHGHEHFITYHPNLVNMEEFYVNVKAVNKAGLETTEIFGPLVVRISGPAFNDDITVLYEKVDSDVLIASFGDAPYDTDDVVHDYLETITYALAEGSCGGDLISWSEIDNVDESFGCGNTWPQTCVVIDTQAHGFHLHHNTSYCLSVRLQGVNKLTTTVTASYTHTQSTPAAGIIWEIDPSGDDLVAKDIDFQTATDVIYLRYLSKESNADGGLHYLVGIGMTAGQDDVKAFDSVDVGSVVDVDGLTLRDHTKYYATLKIIDLETDEYSVVSSDGIMILSENTTLGSLLVYDGVLCTADEPISHQGLNHHNDSSNVPSCGVEVDYQSYTTVLDVYWTYDVTDAYIQYFLISVEKQVTSNDAIVWESILTDSAVSTVTSASLTGLYLEAGETYRVVVQGCHPAGCYMPEASDGVTILPTEPIAKDIIDVVYNDNDTSLTVTWNPFVDPYHGVNFDVISQYAIALFVRPENTEMNQITQWKHLQTGDYNIDAITNKINVTYTLDHGLEPSSCLVLGVRGYNGAMLYSTAYKDFLGCTVPDRYPLHILDAVGEIQEDGTTGDISLVTNDAWPLADAEYTRSKTSVAAVWPTVKHGYMTWSVVHGDSVKRVAYKKSNLAHLEYWDFDCASPEVLACGSTYDRFVNVHNLILEEGSRYHVCIYADDTVITHEKWNETLPALSVCSNGVTVDTEPPLAGLVWIGNRQEHNHFQSDNLVLVVHWSSFVDVEVSLNTAHHSGIKTYLLAIGSSSGGIDVLDFHDVGLTNVKVITGLSLRNGGNYFVTIKAQDYVDLETAVTSDGVTIDLTHPVIEKSKLTVSGSFLSAEKSIQIAYANGAFVDPESGISEYYWCIGSRPSLCDTLGRAYLLDPLLSVSSTMAAFVDGQQYHVLLEAFNGAGLSVSTIAATFVVDVTAPIAGFVHEVSATSTVEIDYQESPEDLYVAWGEFQDAESPIVEYRLTIGSCESCTDILNDVYVGLVQEYHITHLELQQGVEYSTSVKACNSANLCTVAMSDGITVDGTPPHLARVYDGLFDEDRDYTPESNIVSAHLENVHDLQSGLSIITWWAGTSSGDTDVFAEETTYSHTVLHKTLDSDLSDGTTVYVTVKACNKAGLCSTKSSDGSTIDITAPSMTGSIERISTVGSLVSDYQVYRSTLSVQWQASEDGSPIVLTYISLLPQDDAHLTLPTVKLVGNPESYTLSGLDLRDGDCYVVKVTVCNAASLCSQETSTDFKVDSSPPTGGAFAVDTEHALELDRQRDGWMTYDNAHADGPQVKLAWVGFQDPHSDILRYNIKMGTGFHSSDIADHEAEHQTADEHGDEGFVITESVALSQTLTANEEIYISMTATNQAGLQSTILHGLFEAIPSGGDTGTLELERRCDTLSCIGHCMCAAHGHHSCDPVAPSCSDKTGDGSYAVITVSDVIPTVESTTISEVDVIPTLHILHAQWTVDASGIQPVWFDWSVGIQGETEGSGLLDINVQPIWYEAGTATNAIFSMTTSKLTDEMSTHVTYVFYIKAWYDASSYAVFQSDGVQVDGTAPELSDSYSVIEVSDPDTSGDIDFTTSASTITVKWGNVFIDSQSDMKSYEVMLYSNKMLSVVASEQAAGDSEQLTMSSLSLKEGEHYVSKVVGCNEAGLCTEATSDGFMLDTTPPIQGSVLDGTGFHDIDYSNDEVSASWEGFYDDESFIDHYVWCYSVGGTERECSDVGLNQYNQISLPGDINDGEVVYSTVQATNAAGLSSTAVESNGFIVDKSPPFDSHYFQFEASIVLNANFESSTDNWDINAELTEILDNSLCILHGIIKQDIATIENQKYRLQFDAVSTTGSEDSASLGYLKFGEKEHHVISAADIDDELHLRQKVYFMTAQSTSSSLEFGTMTDTMLCVGNIRLESITDGPREAVDVSHPEAEFSSSVHVHVIASSLGTTLILNWDFDDAETPVVDYMFAVGTVEGGIQVQDFRSTGHATTSTVSGLKVQHNTTLYVTVVARNAAALSTVVYADPVIVDLTPPHISFFQVNGGDMVLPTSELSVEWEASDDESGVEHCDFSIENHDAGGFDFTTLSWSASGRDTLSLTDINNGDTISCHMICKSFRDLYAEATVGPLTYVTEPANIDSANLYIVPNSETYYENRENYFSAADTIWFRWDGIVDPVGIEHCEVLVSDGTNTIIDTVSLGTNLHSTAVFQNGSTVFLDNSAYDVQLTCVNRGGYMSDPVTKQFYIDASVPSYTGELLGIFWASQTQLKLNWNGLFTATTPLVYELNLGTSVGGLDVLSWLETKDTELEITDVNSALTHYLSISAIAQSGLFVTQTFIIRY